MRLFPLALAAVALSIGCGQKSPPIDPDQFPRAVASIESKTEEIIEAFDSGSPEAADRPLHMLPKTFSTAKRLAGQAGLDAGQKSALDAALNDLLDAFGELHAPLHEEEFPEDFDFAPIKERLLDGLKGVRGALPATALEVVQASSDKRAARRAEAEAAQAAREAGEASADAPQEEPPADTAEGQGDDAATLAPEAEAEAIDETTEPPAGTSSRRGVPTGGLPAVSVALAPDAAAAPPPICPTVMMFDAAGWSSAPERINRSAELLADAPPGSRWVQTVPTLHAKLRPDRTIEAYGLVEARGAGGPKNFVTATDDLASRLRDEFAAALGQAVRRGLHVSVLPHLDAGGEVYAWRNHFVFEPDMPIGVGSYESLLIEPLADAIIAEATPDTRIDLCLSGEMGQSLFENPDGYRRLIVRLRERFAGQPDTAGVRLGVALNWNGLAGEAKTTSIDRAAVAEFFAACDFVGMSCYSPVSVPPAAADFATAVKNFVEELRGLGGDVGPRVGFVISEVGVGGGEPSPAAKESEEWPRLADIAAQPWAGSGSGRQNPWRRTDAIAFRRGFHSALADHLIASQAAPVGESTPIEKAFLWSEGPWDPQGVADQRFRDEVIAEQIARHNAAQRGGSL